MRRLGLALVTLALAAVEAGPSPTDSQEVEHQCEAFSGHGDAFKCNNGQYEIKGRFNEHVTVDCMKNEINCSTFPRLSFSKNSTIEEAILSNCAYHEPIACLLRKMNISRVNSIGLDFIFTPVTKRHMEGLEALPQLWIYSRKGVQLSIPHDVISAMPNLMNFQLKYASVELKPRQFQAPQLTHLELVRNYIKDLPPGAFEGLPNLEHLDLSLNKINLLKDDAFRGLGKLRTLAIVTILNNPISSWSTRALSPLVNLRQLEITTRRVPGGVFRDLPKLENISIRSPEPLILDPSAFGNLTALRNLKVYHSRIQDLPSTVFYGSKLLELSLTQNELENLHRDLFKDQSELVKLVLSYNRLKTLQADVFKPLVKLIELDIVFNRIEVLDNFVFSSLPNLQILRAYQNQLKHIADSAFHAVPLRILDLNGNQLSFDSDPFKSLTELEELSLRGNRVDAMCRSWQDSLPKLTKLDLSFNKFTKLNSSDFSYLNKYLLVDLQNNKISSMALDPSIASKSFFIFDGNPLNCDCHMYYFVKAATSAAYLRHFNLGGSRCTSPNSLKGVHVLKVPLDRFKCEEKNCASDCKCIFKSSRNIVEAQCSNLSHQQSNLTTAVSLKLIHAPTSLKHLPFNNVTEIDLSGLNLTGMPYDQFPTTVKFINLSNNYLEYFPNQLFSWDIKFALENNSFDCDCRNYEYVANMLQNVPKIVDFEKVTCENGTLLSDAIRLCEVSPAAIIGISLAVFGVICIILATIVYKCSFEVKICLAKYLPCLLPEEKYDASKKYDVFISYAHPDADFVCDELLVRLEGPPNHLKTCVHHRDWLAGETIPYNIAKSVEESRRTLIVLSTNFLDSIWAMMEFRVAHTQAAKEGRARIVIVLLEDVTNKDDLDRELHAYLHTNTYIKWGEPWFWEKLFYALPKKGRVVHTGEERRIQAVANELVPIRRSYFN